jgi:uncharacterized protein (TIGR02246 family)
MWRLLLIGILIGGVMAKITKAQISSLQRDDEQAIRKLVADWKVAIKNKDVPRLLTFITDDAVFLTSNTPPLKGKKAVESLYRDIFARFNVEQETTTEEIEVDGDRAFTWGTDALTLIPVAGGNPIKLKGYGMTILQRRPDGSWRIMRGINNMTPETSPPASRQ